MGLASDVDFFDCQDCGWRGYKPAPIRAYGTVSTPPVIPNCPQCGQGNVVKS